MGDTQRGPEPGAPGRPEGPTPHLRPPELAPWTVHLEFARSTWRPAQHPCAVHPLRKQCVLGARGPVRAHCWGPPTMPRGWVRRPEVTLKRQVLEVDSGCFWGHLESEGGSVHWLSGRLSGELPHFLQDRLQSANGLVRSWEPAHKAQPTWLLTGCRKETAGSAQLGQSSWRSGP